MATDAFAGSGVITTPWVDFLSASGPKLAQSGGNVAAQSGGESTGFYYGGAASGDSQYSEITLAGSLGSAQTYWSATVNTTGNNGTRTYYSITVTSDHWYLAKKVSGSNSWETDGAGTFGSGHVVRLEVTVSGANRVLTAYKDGVEFATNTDTSSVLTGGQPGLEVYAHISFLTPVSEWSGDDLGGGSTADAYVTLPPLAPPRRR